MLFHTGNWMDVFFSFSFLNWLSMARKHKQKGSVNPQCLKDKIQIATRMHYHMILLSDRFDALEHEFCKTLPAYEQGEISAGNMYG